MEKFSNQNACFGSRPQSCVSVGALGALGTSHLSTDESFGAILTFGEGGVIFHSFRAFLWRNKFNLVFPISNVKWEM